MLVLTLYIISEASIELNFLVVPVFFYLSVCKRNSQQLDADAADCDSFPG